MKISITQKGTASKPSNKKEISAYDERIGAWARVDKINSEDNSVNVYLDTGVYLKSVPAASREWVRPGVEVDIKYNTGERDLPPVGSKVFVLMPTFTLDDCFILPISSFNTRDKNASAPFLGENIGSIKERITPSGWHITNDHFTGSHKSVSPDEKTSLEIDYGTEEEEKEKPELHLNIFDNIQADVVAEDNITLSVFDEVKIEHKKGDSCKIKVFDTELVIKNGEVSIKPKETAIEADGNITIKTSGDTTVEASGNAKVEAKANADVKGVNVTVEASAMLTLNSGDAAPWMPNCVPVCPWGMPHGGPGAGIVKLKGG